MTAILRSAFPGTRREASRFALAYGLRLSPPREPLTVAVIYTTERVRALERLLELGFTQAEDIYREIWDD